MQTNVQIDSNASHHIKHRDHVTIEVSSWYNFYVSIPQWKEWWVGEICSSIRIKIHYSCFILSNTKVFTVRSEQSIAPLQSRRNRKFSIKSNRWREIRKTISLPQKENGVRLEVSYSWRLINSRKTDVNVTRAKFILNIFTLFILNIYHFLFFPNYLNTLRHLYLRISSVIQ